jgi:hypothetical protein
MATVVLVEGNTFSLKVGDGRTIEGLPLSSEQPDLQPVYDEIFAYAKGIFAKPVDYFDAQQHGKIGFLSR